MASTASTVEAAGSPADDEAAVLAAVDCYWRTIVEANDPPNPEHQGFTECFTGPAFERSRGNVQRRLATGHSVIDDTGIERTDPVIEIGVGTASVRQCFVDDSTTIATDARTVIDASVSSYDVEFRLRRSGVPGWWKTTSARTGVPGGPADGRLDGWVPPGASAIGSWRLPRTARSSDRRASASRSSGQHPMRQDHPDDHGAVPVGGRADRRHGPPTSRRPRRDGAEVPAGVSRQRRRWRR